MSPTEIEFRLLNHKAVENCAVIGVVDHRGVQVPRAFVVKSEAARSEENERLGRELIDWVRGGLVEATSGWKVGSSFVNRFP